MIRMILIALVHGIDHSDGMQTMTLLSRCQLFAQTWVIKMSRKDECINNLRLYLLIRPLPCKLMICSICSMVSLIKFYNKYTTLQSASISTWLSWWFALFWSSLPLLMDLGLQDPHFLLLWNLSCV